MRHCEGWTAIRLTVNGEARELMVEAHDTLLGALRDRLGLTGAKPGCENGDCGACTVIVNGRPRKSCLVLAMEVEGQDVETVEGLKQAPSQQAFLDHWAFQCGYCTSGFLMVAEALRRAHPGADAETITEWLRSNICRCTGYVEIFAALADIVGGESAPPDR
jgi:carbon-monoxide dehydrogenase small subunit